MVIYASELIQTDVEDLCGESTGVKKRKGIRKPTVPRNTQMLQQLKKQQTYVRSTSIVFNRLIDPGCNLVAQKNGHTKIRDLISMIKEVIYH